LEPAIWVGFNMTIATHGALVGLGTWHLFIQNKSHKSKLEQQGAGIHKEPPRIQHPFCTGNLAGATNMGMDNSDTPSLSANCIALDAKVS
jgi:hypothetical protein